MRRNNNRILTAKRIIKAILPLVLLLIRHDRIVQGAHAVAAAAAGTTSGTGSNHPGVARLIHSPYHRHSAAAESTRTEVEMPSIFLSAIFNICNGCRHRHTPKQLLRNHFRLMTRNQLLFMQQLRGGSTTMAAADTTSTTATTSTDATAQQKQQVHAYRLQQQLYLQSRSLQLRQALIQRGFDELQHCVTDSTTAAAAAVEIDWDCALATDAHPKSCLYSFDAPIPSKVVAPANTTQYITLSALNRLRRNDPTKIEPLWHSQYKILNTWFHPNHPFSIYTHLGFTGTILAVLLDTPWLLAMALGVTLLFSIILALPLLEIIVQMIVTMPFVWQHWPSWGRFVHAALPLKLLLGQMGFKFASTVWNKLFHAIRNRLVEVECDFLEECTPLTIVEDDDEYQQREAEDDDSDTEGEDE